MDDAAIVRRLDGLGDLAGDLQRLIAGERAAREAVGQRLPFDQFEHEKRRRGRFDEIVNRGDPRVVERREHLGFATQPRDAVLILGKRLRQDLDRDVAFQLGIARAVDLAHATGTQRSDDFIVAQPLAGSECHGWWGL
jgi:hypothetical protein